MAVLAVAAGYFIHTRIYESMPHIEDEMAYVWQAQAIAGGHLTLPSPPESKSFLIPFVIDYHGQRFGKYPLGWPVMLAVGEFFGHREWVNPLLSGLALWLIYLLVKRLLGEPAGVVAALLTLTSPFFLLNAGSLLSHPFGLVLSVAFTLAWLDAFVYHDFARPWLPVSVAAGTLALLALSRPLTAVCVALPFGLHGVWLLWRGGWTTRKQVLAIGAVVLLLGSLHFAWQYAVTGDPTLNPYTLWWPYDKVGFGPGYGHSEGGHTLHQAWINTRFSLNVGAADLFGWYNLSWLFLPVGAAVLVYKRNGPALLVAALIPSLVILYMAYWIGSHLFGPRYYFEGLHAVVMVSAAGIAWLAGWPMRVGEPFVRREGWRRWLGPAMLALVAVLVFASVRYYIPQRVYMLYNLYGVNRTALAPFETPEAQAMTPALIIVHTSKDWIEYGRLTTLQTPFLDTPFIFVISRGVRADQAVAAAFPNRTAYDYYPGKDPWKFEKR